VAGRSGRSGEVGRRRRRTRPETAAQRIHSDAAAISLSAPLRARAFVAQAFFTHAPGLKVVIPSSPADAKGLLLAAIADPNPVLFFEPKMMYRGAAEPVPSGWHTVPLGFARTLRPGEDVTLVGWGQQVHVLMAAAEAAAAAHGISCEVIDLRTLLPWDVRCVQASVNRTGRLVVSHEAPLTGGFGAEIVATIARRCFTRLESPPLRVCGRDTPFPLTLEPLYLPGVQRVLDAIVAAVKF